MPGSRRAKRGTKPKSAEAPIGKMWDKQSLDEHDGRANTNAGSKGKEPGGRWSPAYYESGPKVITRDIVRDA